MIPIDALTWPMAMVLRESLPGILSVFSLTSIVCILFSSCLWIAEGTPLGGHVKIKMSGNYFDLRISKNSDASETEGLFRDLPASAVPSGRVRQANEAQPHSAPH